MAKNFGFGMAKSLTGSGEQYATVCVEHGQIVAPGLTITAAWMKAAAPYGLNLENKTVRVRAMDDGRIHAQVSGPKFNRSYGASFDFVHWDLAGYLNGNGKPVANPFAAAPKPEVKTVADLFVLFGYSVPTGEPTPAPKPVSAPTPKPTFTPTVAPKYTNTPSNFGKVESLAGTGKQYTLVFCQDHKIITPAGILDGTAIRKACAAAGGNLDRKYVQVRLNGGDSIHAQLPDDDTNRPYGTSFDFVDATLAAYLRG